MHYIGITGLKLHTIISNEVTLMIQSVKSEFQVNEMFLTTHCLVS